MCEEQTISEGLGSYNIPGSHLPVDTRKIELTRSFRGTCCQLLSNCTIRWWLPFKYYRTWFLFIL